MDCTNIKIDMMLYGYNCIIKMSESEKIVYIVVSEEYYGGEELVLVFSNQEDAQRYADAIGKKRNLDMNILKRILREDVSIIN